MPSNLNPQAQKLRGRGGRVDRAASAIRIFQAARNLTFLRQKYKVVYNISDELKF